MRKPRVRIGCMAALRLSGVLAALAAAGALAAASWAGDAPTKRFLDAAGDNGPAADITAVAVSYHADQLVFEISLAGRAALRPGDAVLVVLDSDDDRSTGGGGLDYAAALGGNGELRFFRWDGQRLAPAPAPGGLEGGYAAGVARITIPRAGVGSPVRFQFAVGTPWRDGDEVEMDFAPETGYWSYSLLGQMQSLAVGFLHRQRLLELDRDSVRVGTSTGLSVRPDSVRCRARTHSRRLQPARACAWRIPAWAKRQPLRVSITVRVSEQRRTFVRRIQASTPSSAFARGRTSPACSPDEAARAEQSSDVLTFPTRRPARSVEDMPTYLVETYLARGGAGERTRRERRARSAAEELTREGTRVRFDRLIHVPEDEICFFVFDAPSGREAALAAQRAWLAPLRVVGVLSPRRERQC